MRTSLVIALTALALGVVPACGGGSTDAPPSSSASPSEQAAPAETGPDGAFAKKLAEGHGEMIQLAVAAANSKNPKVTDLADRIRNAREAQIDQVAGWLGSKNDTLPPSPAEGSPAVKSLPGVEDARFDRAWASAMLLLNKQGRSLVTAHAAEGADAEMRELAQILVGELDKESAELTALAA